MYCTLVDLKKKMREDMIIKLADHNKTNPASLDEAGEDVLSVIDQAISEADAKIDTYISQRYNTPLDPVPKSIKYLSADISIYNLYVLRDFAKIPDTWEKRHDAAISLLRLMAKGDVKLNLGTDDAPEATKPSSSEFQGGGAMFSMDSTRGL